jgi:hypothetical protein
MVNDREAGPALISALALFAFGPSTKRPGPLVAGLGPCARSNRPRSYAALGEIGSVEILASQ